MTARRTRAGRLLIQDRRRTRTATRRTGVHLHVFGASRRSAAIPCAWSGLVGGVPSRRRNERGQPDHHAGEQLEPNDHGPVDRQSMVPAADRARHRWAHCCRREDRSTTGPAMSRGGAFDPASDGIDFYETVEGMTLQVNNPVRGRADRNSYGEVWTLADRRRRRSVRTNRGGIVLRDYSTRSPPAITRPDDLRSPSASRRRRGWHADAEHERRRPVRRSRVDRRAGLQLRELQDAADVPAARSSSGLNSARPRSRLERARSRSPHSTSRTSAGTSPGEVRRTSRLADREQPAGAGHRRRSRRSRTTTAQ